MSVRAVIMVFVDDGQDFGMGGEELDSVFG